MRRKHAKLERVQQEEIKVPVNTPDGRVAYEDVSYWVAVDSAGRKFMAKTEKEAVKMLEEYNK